LTARLAFSAHRIGKTALRFARYVFRNDRLSRMFIPRRNISENHLDFVQAPTES
jgi:hypothetical protein